MTYGQSREARSPTRRASWFKQASLWTLCGLSLLAAASWAHEDRHPVDAAMMKQRAALLEQAEGALQQGDVPVAERGFERAAGMLHAPDTEMGLVRTYMQAGDYRKALAFAAHTAGAHPDEPAGSVLYAWLLQLGAQPAVARMTLDKVPESVAGLGSLAQARAQLLSLSPVASGALLMPPMRLAPYPGMVDVRGEAVPSHARVSGSGVLLADGLHALVPAMALGDGDVRIWLRDGLGRTVSAQRAQALSALGLVLLKLDAPLSHQGDEGASARWRVPAHDVFPGSPGFALAYAETDEAQAAWPVMRLGFMGISDGPSGWRRLGIDMPVARLGGPVLDAAGRLVGVALGASGAAPAAMVPISVLRQQFGERFGPVSALAPGQRMPTDEVYENGLRQTLQLITASR